MDYLMIFLEGIITFISPCILPMLPLYVSYFMGQNNGMDEKTNIKILINVLGFIFGFTCIFTLLGVISASLGNIVKEYIRYINIVLGVLIIILGLNFMEFINIKTLNKTKGINLKMKKINFISSIVFGVIFGITWSPCVGTFLGTALSIIAINGNIIKGIALIITYCLGLGIPFILSTLLIDKLKNTFNYIKTHYNVITKVCGMFLCIIGVLMVTGLIDKYFEIVG